ncbi:glycosyltransferase [Arthrospiribacter ruber]|uniref:Glycosyltransferase n=1 Tax=Arthrospiribacter ruber TaxID=2487934 RepID=A0A951IXX8_9BACT|nr:glycosyltransferase [Arthrospiribacter ruber]MBW3468314.1 glycosyltransferase [Arthrospiribacter ruber]
MKKLLIISKEQFGYHIDTFKYAFYLKEELEITYICLDQGLKKKNIENVEVIYVSKNIFKPFTLFTLLRTVILENKKNKFDFIFILYFVGCSILKILDRKSNIILDIRTLSVEKSNFINRFLDKILKLETLFFENITLVGENIAKKIGLRKYQLLPLGGERFSSKSKQITGFNLLYVGTLSNRNILDFVKGFHSFLMSLPLNNRKDVSFVIVGSGYGNELESIKKYIYTNGLAEHITTTGYVQNDELGMYFNKANIGVSFIPITPYFENQPPTKTYEYLLSGLVVLATSTKENAKLINESNGVLIKDTPESVRSGLVRLYAEREKFNPKMISKEFEDHLWENISQNILKPYLEKIHHK